MKLYFSVIVLFLFGCESSNLKPNLPSLAVKHQITKSNIKLPQYIVDSLKSGDIILRRGDGPLSFHLSNTTKEPYTHCGVIVKDSNQWNVIHSIGGQVSKQEIDGVQKISLTHFINNASDSLLYLCRPIFTEKANQKVANRAQYYLKQKVPFDHRFTLLTKDKFYCSELLYYIFKDVNNNKNIFTIKKKHKAYLLMFSTFFNSSNFKKIYAVNPKKIK